MEKNECADWHKDLCGFTGEYSQLEQDVKNLRLLADICKNTGGVFSGSVEHHQDGICINLPKGLIIVFLENELASAAQSLDAIRHKMEGILQIVREGEFK